MLNHLLIITFENLYALSAKLPQTAFCPQYLLSAYCGVSWFACEVPWIVMQTYFSISKPCIFHRYCRLTKDKSLTAGCKWFHVAQVCHISKNLNPCFNVQSIQNQRMHKRLYRQWIAKITVMMHSSTIAFFSLLKDPAYKANLHLANSNDSFS